MNVACNSWGRSAVLALTATLVIAAPSVAAQLNFDRLYIFGDSLSDTGNSFGFTGQGIPPSPPYAAGRFSNGLIWTDFLGESLDLTPATLVQTQAGPGGASGALTDGVNFAFGGANTGSTNSNNRLLPLGSPSLPGVSTQVQLYQSLLAADAANPENALFVYWAGANDYLNNGVTEAQVPLANIGQDLEALYGAGARNFLVANLPALGETPIGQLRGAAALNQLTSTHNRGLDTVLNNFSQSRSDAQVSTLDAGSLFDGVLQDPAQFGFSSTGGCFQIADLATNPPDPTELATCGATSLFYDELHPTSQAHRLVADLAIETLEKPASQKVSEPTGWLGLLLASGLGLMGLRHRAIRAKREGAQASYPISDPPIS